VVKVFDDLRMEEDRQEFPLNCHDPWLFSARSFPFVERNIQLLRGRSKLQEKDHGNDRKSDISKNLVKIFWIWWSHVKTLHRAWICLTCEFRL
jgi:hypothetical protein